jgi:hypothetical protein
VYQKTFATFQTSPCSKKQHRVQNKIKLCRRLQQKRTNAPTFVPTHPRLQGKRI